MKASRGHSKSSTMRIGAIAVGLSVVLNAGAFAMLEFLNRDQAMAEATLQTQAMERIDLPPRPAPMLKPIELERIKALPQQSAQSASKQQASKAQATPLAMNLTLTSNRSDFALPAQPQRTSKSASELPRYDIRVPAAPEAESSDAPVVEASDTDASASDTGNAPSSSDSAGTSDPASIKPPQPVIAAIISDTGNPADHLPRRIRGRFSGTTKLRLHVSATGAITRVEHIESNVSTGYDDYAKDAAIEYAKSGSISVTPARRGGVAIASTPEVEIHWTTK